jgi:serine/threonine-protein kinase HipA
MEASCLRIARAVGLTSVEATVESIGGADCLIVSRFDRAELGGRLVRLHQEDACQALGRDPDAADRKGKYEAAGGPSLKEIARLLDTHAARPVDELHKLVATTTFTTLIGNADAHGKNVAFVHAEPGRIELAPLYDTVPTSLWPKLPDRAAMFVNGRLRLPDVTIDDVVAEARSWSLEGAAATAAETVDKIVSTLDEGDVPPKLKAAITKRAKAFTSSAG